MAIEECLVIIAAGIHPVTFRTRKLSLPAPKILGLSSRENRSSPNFFCFKFNIVLSLFLSVHHSFFIIFFILLPFFDILNTYDGA